MVGRFLAGRHLTTNVDEPEESHPRWTAVGQHGTGPAPSPSKRDPRREEPAVQLGTGWGVFRLALSMLLPTILLVSSGESNGRRSRWARWHQIPVIRVVADHRASGSSGRYAGHSGADGHQHLRIRNSSLGVPGLFAVELEHGVTFYGSALLTLLTVQVSSGAP